MSVGRMWDDAVMQMCPSGGDVAEAGGCNYAHKFSCRPYMPLNVVEPNFFYNQKTTTFSHTMTIGRPRKRKKRYKPTPPKPKLYRRWMSYKAARQTVQDVGGITSRSKFWEWHDKVHPYYIPKMPDHVYDDWISWNDFLGVDNTWDGYDRARKVGQWMPYWEAVRLVQRLGLKNKNEYLDAYDAQKVDKRIPKAPDQTYGDEWTGWKSFLGTDINVKVESAAKVEGVLCFCTSKGMPSNVLEVLVAPEGRGQLQSKLEARDDLTPVKKYVWETALWGRVKQVLSVLGTERDDNVYVFPNVNAVWYELDSILLMTR